MYHVLGGHQLMFWARSIQLWYLNIILAETIWWEVFGKPVGTSALFSWLSFPPRRGTASQDLLYAEMHVHLSSNIQNHSNVWTLIHWPVWDWDFCSSSLGFCGLQAFVMFFEALPSFYRIRPVYWPAETSCHFCCHGVVCLVCNTVKMDGTWKNGIRTNGRTRDFLSRTSHRNEMINISHLSVVSLLLLIGVEKHDELIYNWICSGPGHTDSPWINKS